MSDTTDGWLRVRGLLERHLTAIVVGLLLVAAIGGFLTYDAYATADRETVTEQVSAWESTGGFDHRATVVNGSQVFTEGEVLRNRSVYLLATSPVVEGAFSYGYSATDGGAIDASSRLELVIRSVSEADGNATEYWRYTEPLSSASSTLAPDESVEATFALDMRDVASRIDQLRADLGQTPGTTETFLLATVQLQGTRNSESVDRRRTYRLPISIEGDYVRIEGGGPVQHQGEQLGQRVTTVQPGLLRALGGPILLILGLAGLGGLGLGRYRGQLETSEREREYLTYRRERAEFDEWISEAYVPSHRVSEADTHVKTTSLGGLVDLAIDIDRRVLETPDRNQFIVLDGDVVYTYEPPTPLPAGEGQQLRT